MRLIDEMMLKYICQFRQLRYKEGSHSKMEWFCRKDNNVHYERAPLCKFQCTKEANNEPNDPEH